MLAWNCPIDDCPAKSHDPALMLCHIIFTHEVRD